MSIISKIKMISELVKFEHTAFALPFAFMGALIGSRGRLSLRQTAFILLAMAGARTAAMAFNRLADHEYDAKNSRTSGRALPSGLISRPAVWALVIFSLAVFLYSARALNDVCFKLSPVAMFLLLFYSYTKRFTSLSHFVLGLVLAAAPVGGFLAVSPELKMAPLVLAGSVLLWVAGFDIIYACQDIEFDRAHGLHSLPAKRGILKSLFTARALHLLTIAGFCATGILYGAGAAYYTSVAVCGLLLIYEHRLLSGGSLEKVNAAFFDMNGYVAVMMFAGTFADCYFRK